MTDTTLQQNLEAILNIARLAPSVHNTQPWQVSASGNNLTITINKLHQLHDGDPTGRETVISFGIFAEAIVLAARQFNLAVHGISYGNYQVDMSFDESDDQDANNGLIKALETRCTDRSIYSPANLPNDAQDVIRSSYAAPGVAIHATTDENIIGKVADLTSRAIGVALSSPGFRKELAAYLRNPWSSSQRGISTMSLYIPWPLAVIEPILLKHGIGLKAEARLEKKRWNSASGLVFITADGDMPKYWLETGRAYLHASLALEQAGVSQATSAAIVEASNYHEDIEELLGTKQRILSVIRYGKGSANRHYSPRVTANELITSS